MIKQIDTDIFLYEFNNYFECKECGLKHNVYHRFLDTNYIPNYTAKVHVLCNCLTSYNIDFNDKILVCTKCSDNLSTDDDDDEFAGLIKALNTINGGCSSNHSNPSYNSDDDYYKNGDCNSDRSNNEPKCECGASAVGALRHSPWCPLYQEEE